MNRCAGQRKSRATGSRDHERFTITGQLISVQVFICWHRLGSRSSLPPDMNDQLISVLAPDRDILHFEPRLVIALNPLEAEKQVQTDILLFTICKDQPGFEVRSFMYSFAGAYDLKGILPLVERNARRKAVELAVAQHTGNVAHRRLRWNLTIRRCCLYLCRRLPGECAACTP